MVQSIHSLDKSQFKKYKPNLILAGIVILSLITLLLLLKSGNTIIQYLKVSKEVKILNNTYQEKTKELNRVQSEVENNELFSEFSVEGTVIDASVKKYYPNIDLYTYLFTKPGTINFQKISINEEMLILYGQAISYGNLLEYVEKLKEDGLFSSINLKSTAFIPVVNQVVFELELIKPTEIEIDPEQSSKNLDYLSNSSEIMVNPDAENQGNQGNPEVTENTNKAPDISSEITVDGFEGGS